MPKPTLIVNLYGGPGAGKTTCAWEIASELKKRGYNVEYAPEYAKDLVYEGRTDLLGGTVEHQTLLFREQKHRLDRLIGKVEMVVTDSPLLLSQVYLQEKDPTFLRTVRQASDEYHSFNLVVRRGDTFQQAGRIHNEQQSKQLDSEILRMLDANGLYYGVYDHSRIPICVSNIERTYKRISEELANKKQWEYLQSESQNEQTKTSADSDLSVDQAQELEQPLENTAGLAQEEIELQAMLI